MDDLLALDVLIASKIMGWQNPHVGVRGQARFTRPGAHDPVNVGPGEEFSPSTNLTQACDLLYDIPYRGENLLLLVHPANHGFAVAHLPNNTGAPEIIAEGETLQLAICNAVIKQNERTT